MRVRNLADGDEVKTVNDPQFALEVLLSCGYGMEKANELLLSLQTDKNGKILSTSGLSSWKGSSTILDTNKYRRDRGTASPKKQEWLAVRASKPLRICEFLVARAPYVPNLENLWIPFRSELLHEMVDGWIRGTL